MKINKPIIDFKNLNCTNCPAEKNREEYREHFECCENLREQEIEKIKKIKLYLLGESIPANRFIYVRKKDLKKNSLKNILKIIFVGEEKDDEDLFNYLIENGILIVDCALCPIHKSEFTNTLRRKAATKCLLNHTYRYLEINKKALIIPITPKKRGYKINILREKRHDIANRIRKDKDISFWHLDGIKDKIENLLNEKQ